MHRAAHLLLLAALAALAALASSTLLACSDSTPDAAVMSTTAAGGQGQGGAGGAGASGTAGSGAVVEPIADVKENDADGVPLRLGETVTVRGIVTVPSDLMSYENHEIYLQDETAGISVYEEGLQSFTTALGDELEVTGRIGQYEGKTEIDLPSVTLLASGQPVPAPVELTTAELCAAGEPYDCMLCVLRGVTIAGGEPWPTVEQAGNANLVVDDGSGPCDLRIDHQTALNGSPEPGGAFDVVGVVKQYDTSLPYTSGYALQPRYLEDVTPLD